MQNPGHRIILNAEDNVLVVSDTVATLETVRFTSQNVAEYKSIPELEEAAGTDFRCPLGGFRVTSQLRQWVAAAVQGNRSVMVDCVLCAGRCKAMMEVSSTCTVCTILEPTTEADAEESVTFHIKGARIKALPVGTEITIYSVKDSPDRGVWVAQGLANKNPVVPFRIVGKSSISC